MSALRAAKKQEEASGTNRAAKGHLESPVEATRQREKKEVIYLCGDMGVGAFHFLLQGAYEQAMEDNGIQDWEAVDGFHLIVVLEFKARIAEIQAHQGAKWQDFKKAMKEEYFLEDSQRVTKQSLMKWIKQWNKEQVEIFVQAADARLQKSLEQLLEDASREIGLTSYWKLVFEAVNVIVKQHMRVDKLIVPNSTKSSDEEAKDKSATLKHKLEEPVLDDLVKCIQELNLNLKAVKLEGLSVYRN
ncbi:hypothetical protein L7F22_006780 [Adiantum nelumboides]|nr:hypothetical protein [Adiantum nelumboides]